MKYKQQNGQRVLETSLKNKKYGGREDVFRKFSSRFLPLTGSGQIQRKTKNPVLIVFLGLKERCHDSCHPSQFLQTLVSIFPWKSTRVKIHPKMANFWLVFSAKNPVKSDKLPSIQGKILNLMFLDFYTPVVPIENWLRVTHNQR